MDTEEKRLRRRENNRRYRLRHPDRIRATQIARSEQQKEYLREYYQKNKSRLNLAAKAWRIANLEKKKAADKAWRKTNPIKVKEYQQRWLLKNPQWESNRGSKYYRKNRSKCRANQKRWIERNKQHHLEYHRAYKKNNRHIFKQHEDKRRALKLAATVNLRAISQWMKSVMRREKNTCYYCQTEIPKGKLHFDHIVALSKGGAHSVENLCVSCSRCNSDKHDKPIQAWVKIGQQILAL